jgi:hypothetical protein
MTAASHGRDMLSVFCDIKGIVHSEFTPVGTTINSEWCCETLKAESRTVKSLPSHEAASPVTRQFLHLSSLWVITHKEDKCNIMNHGESLKFNIRQFLPHTMQEELQRFNNISFFASPMT